MQATHKSLGPVRAIDVRSHIIAVEAVIAERRERQLEQAAAEQRRRTASIISAVVGVLRQTAELAFVSTAAVWSTA